MRNSIAPALAPSPRALIVDRDADTRQMYAEYLRLLGFVVEEAEDGREALAKAVARLPNVVVAETRLPGIDGVELCRLLRRDPATRHVHFVFVTGDVSARGLHRAQSSGSDVVLLKPCLPEVLHAELDRLLATAAPVPTSAPPVDPHRPNHATDSPPLEPPRLVCPRCDRALRYKYSHLGGVGVNRPEQWDYFDCASGCGTFQYRHRTRKLRPTTE